MDDDRVRQVGADRRLAPGDVDQLERLANEVAGVTIYKRRVQKTAVDGDITTLEIVAVKSTPIELWAGEDAPEPVWALLSAIEALGWNAESSQR
jgi:hypothetical protein